MAAHDKDTEKKKDAPKKVPTGTLKQRKPNRKEVKSGN